MKIFHYFLLLPVLTGGFISNKIKQAVIPLFSIPIREPSRFNRVNYRRQYPLSRYHHERYLKRLNSRNITEQNQALLGNEENDYDENIIDKLIAKGKLQSQQEEPPKGGIRIFINKNGMFPHNPDENDDDDLFSNFKKRHHGKAKSDNFEIVTESGVKFSDVGGYENIKLELEQCIDIISNYTKYIPYNVRTPKGLIFEGPPGNGKTLLAKALAGEANTSFISVSGSQFQEKYVGVGAGRIRELFELAKDNVPCIVFIDEIDALGRKRSSDGDTSGNERDSTLNELLVALDGFKDMSGVFLIGATNRADLLDNALTRPGRVDKRIFINNPDTVTRRAILDIHIDGKPHDDSINTDDIVEMTNGFSGAQIENLVNEAMLNALRENRFEFNNNDIDVVMNKMIAGWQPSEHQFTQDMIDQIAIHELGHAVVGMLSKHHGKMTKVVINLSAPSTPAYTVFEQPTSNFATREALFEHLMILLAGRIAEEVFYDVSVTTGAINDFEEALKLAQKMVCYYGMGDKLIYPSMSEKYKEMIDSEVASLINDAYGYAEFILLNSKDLIYEGSMMLKENQVLTSEEMLNLMNTKYKDVLNLKL
jgi:cell division protease FtsH